MGRRSGRDPRGLTSDEFVALLPRVRWFRRIGEPHPRDAEVVRIHGWDEWPGPDCEEQEEYYFGKFEVWYAAVFGLARGRRVRTAPLYKSVRRQVEGLAARAVAYDPDKDPWHGPNAAVWWASGHTALVAAGLHVGWELPDELLFLWGWYYNGHWPMWYARVPASGEQPVYLVF